MKYGSYVVLPYVLAGVAFAIPFLFTLIVAVIQACLIKCEDSETDDYNKSYAYKFFKIHLKSAKILLGKAIRLRERDGAIILHGFAFPGTLAIIYVFMSECLIAGTICVFAVSTLVFQDTHVCDVSHKHLDCFFENASWDAEPILCSSYIEQGNSVPLICHELTYNIGAAIGIVGGLMSISSLVFFFVTDIILSFVSSDIYFQILLGILQVIFCIVGIAFIITLAVFTDILKLTVGLQITVAILLAVSLFCLPWCCLKRDESRYYYEGDDREAQLDSSTEIINVPDPLIAPRSSRPQSKHNKRTSYPYERYERRDRPRAKPQSKYGNGASNYHDPYSRDERRGLLSKARK